MNIRPVFGQTRIDTLPVLTREQLMKDAPMCSSGGKLSTDKGEAHDFMENWWCHQHPEQAVGASALLLVGILAYKARQRWLPYAKALVHVSWDQVSKNFLKKGTP